MVLSMMLAGGANAATVPRDTIYAAIMVICNGVVGVCLLVGGWHHREQSFRVEGANSGLALNTNHRTLNAEVIHGVDGDFNGINIFSQCTRNVLLKEIFDGEHRLFTFLVTNITSEKLVQSPRVRIRESHHGLNNPQTTWADRRHR